LSGESSQVASAFPSNDRPTTRTFFAVVSLKRKTQFVGVELTTLIVPLPDSVMPECALVNVKTVSPNAEPSPTAKTPSGTTISFAPLLNAASNAAVSSTIPSPTAQKSLTLLVSRSLSWAVRATAHSPLCVNGSALARSASGYTDGAAADCESAPKISASEGTLLSGVAAFRSTAL